MIEIIFFLIVGVYVLFIGQLILGFGKVKTFEKTNASPKTTFSIIVPFRNEAKNLPHLLASIANLNYPRELFELIMVDDFLRFSKNCTFTLGCFFSIVINSKLVGSIG